MLRRTHALRLALLAAGLSILLSLPLAAGAHTEGVMQIAAEPAGPYMLTVWTSPDPVTTAEELHVAIAVVLADDASPVLEADVLVRLTPEDGGPAVSGPATIENSENKFLHEAILDVADKGAYLVEVFVQDAEGRSGSVSFTLAVEGGAGFNWTLALVAVGLAAVAVILIARSRRGAAKAGRPRPPVDESPAGN